MNPGDDLLARFGLDPDDFDLSFLIDECDTELDGQAGTISWHLDDASLPDLDKEHGDGL